MTPVAASATTAPTSRRRWRSVLAALLLALALGLLSAGPAHAHAELTGTDPTDGAVRATAPSVVTLSFNEAVSPISGAMKLFGPDGAMQVLEASARDTQVSVTMPTDMPQGTWSLAWRVVSADGHPIGGVLTFHIGQPSGPPGQSAQTEPDASVVGGLVIGLTALQYLGLLLAVGSHLFAALVLRTTTDEAGLARVGLVGWVTALLGSVLLVPVQGLRVVGLGWTSLFSTDWLPGVLASTLLASALVAVAAVASRLLHTRPIVAAGAAALGLVAPILVGHTRTMAPVWVMIISDALHLFGAALWLGGLVGLAVLVGRGGRRDPATEVAPAVARFSGLALAAVVVLAGSGLMMAMLVTGDLGSLSQTNYGRTLLVKLALVATAVGLAAWNRFGLVGLVTRQPDRASGWRTLRRVVLGEITVLVLVVAITGSLTQLTPHAHGRQLSRSTTAEVQVTSQGLEVSGHASPLLAGSNRLEFSLVHDGAPVTDLAAVEVTASLPEQDLGPLAATLTPVDGSPGRFVAEFYLPTAGTWEVLVSVRVSDFEQPVAVVKLPIR